MIAEQGYDTKVSLQFLRPANSLCRSVLCESSCGVVGAANPRSLSSIGSKRSRTHLINHGETPRASRRPSRQARGGSIPGVFDRRATPREGMHRRPNAGVIYEMGSSAARAANGAPSAWITSLST